MPDPSPPWSPRTKTIVLIALAIVISLFLAFISQSFTRLLIAALLAFVASYPIRGLDRLGVGHGLAVGISYVSVRVGAVLLLGFGMPALMRSLGEIDWVEIVETTAEWLLANLEDLRLIEVFGTTYDLSAVIDPVIEFLQEAEPGTAVEVDIQRLLDILSSGAGVLVGIASLLVGFVVEFFTILVLALYFSIFLPQVRAGIPDLAPPDYRADVDRLLDRMWLVLDMYASGMVRVGLFIGTFTWLGLWLLGVPGAFSLGAIAGVLNIIPTLGPILAGVPGTVVALVQGSERWDIPNWFFAILVIVWYFVVQQVESQLATPRIMGGAVQTSPLTVFLGVIIGLQVAGILGALVAVPVVLVAREGFRYAHAKLLDQEPFGDDEEPPETVWEPGGEEPVEVPD
ncbi:MAG: AI-2E family transporter [Acidimicrobiia bacterium]